MAALFTLILWTTNKPTKDEAQSIQAGNQDTPDIASRADRGGLGSNIENLLTIVNMAKSKKPKLTKPKKLDLSNAKANFEPDFLTSKVKKAFIYLQKAFTKALILNILIQSVIFGLRLMFWGMLLVGS